MSTDINIQLSPEAYTGLQQAAVAAGRTPVQEAAAALEQIYSASGDYASTGGGDAGKTRPAEDQLGSVSSKERDAGVLGGRIEDYFGAISFAYPNGVTNEQIDADLAREYGRTHDGD